uniref:Uncharacterized protein n=2 Tax=Anopheles stephensi TaxID=30069 RepID=A0A182XWU2_ANOST
MNGQMVGENRIRVCPQDQKQIGKVSTTVFVGGLHNNTTENDLYEFFGKVGPIEYIRYLAEKHFAFVCFEKSVSAKKALKLNNTKLYKHEIRIEPIDAKRSNVKTNKKGHLVPRHKPPKVQSKETNDGAEPKQFHGQVSQKKSEKKRMSKKSGFGSLKEKRVLSKKLKSAAQAKV